VYAQTTNVTGITGDGMAMALRAGIDLVDIEFVQYYYPVVLRWPVTRLLASPTLFPLGARLYNARGERPATVVRCLELDNLVLIAEAITLAALTRQESRGTHYLEEFPEKDDTSWLCNLLIHQGSDSVLQVRKAPVVTV